MAGFTTTRFHKYMIPQEQFPLRLTPHVQVLGNYFFNLFLVTGSDRSALFETGVSGSCNTVIQQLDHLGIAPDYLIPSHPHSDHITGLPGLRDRFPKATVVVAAGARQFLSHPKTLSLMVREDAAISSGLQQAGLSPGRPPLEVVPDLSSSQIVDIRTLLDLGGGITLDLIQVGGHSPGNLIAWVKKENVALVSDSIGFHYPDRGFWPLFFTDLTAWMATMDLIRDLSPGIICPAHHGPILSPGRAMDQAAKATRAVVQTIKETHLTDEQLAQELFKQSYRDEFTLYTETNIQTCSRLLIKRARQVDPDRSPHEPSSN